MPKNKSHRRRGNERHIRIRSTLRRQPDLQKIANTVIALAQAQAEKEAQQDDQTRQQQEAPDAES